MHVSAAVGALSCLPVASHALSHLTGVAVGALAGLSRSGLAPGVKFRCCSTSWLVAWSRKPYSSIRMAAQNVPNDSICYHVCFCTRSAARAVASSSCQHTSSSSPAASAAAVPAEAPKSIHVTVNGRKAEIPAGSSLYDAVGKVGAFVPVLCKHPRLPNTPGACRCDIK